MNKKISNIKYLIKYLKIKKNSIKENNFRNLGIHSFIMNNNNNRKNVIIYNIHLQFVSFEFIHNLIF